MASLVAQTLNNWHEMQEILVQPLGHEDLLEKGMAPHSSILAWRIQWTGAWRATAQGIPKIRHD